MPKLSHSLDAARAAALAAWLDAQFDGAAYAMTPASADASFRRYFRVTFPSSPPVSQAGRPSLIVMDAPPDKEDCRPFIKVAGLLRGCGVNAPEIFAQDVAQGFLLLADLGDTTYQTALERGANAQALYRDAITALAAFQRIEAPALPAYDEALLRRELDLFPDWFVARHCGHEWRDAERAMLERTFALLIAAARTQPQVFVHRDYHVRNLMDVAENRPGVLDFQDAVVGPITYDLVSLLRDAYVAWDEEQQLDWAIRYWERARAVGLPVAARFDDFWRDFEWMGVQRHLKVVGIFARLWHRDGKNAYLADVPRVLGYLRQACARYTELMPLLRFLDVLEKREPVIGYTF
ncbi:MAG: phosphotransferase [Betaproteobacteria bacterium]|nr:phosphotransferase [Betaproteobacteria bacterium]